VGRPAWSPSEANANIRICPPRPNNWGGCS
jgi:hypothetical protein